MTILDFTIIGIYLLSLLAIGFLVKKNSTVEGYFTNSRSTNLFTLLCASFSTSIGAGVLLGTASAAYSSGVSYAILIAIVTLFGWLLLAFFVPKIKKITDEIKAYTIGDYFECVYSSRVRKISRLVIIASYFVLTALQFLALSSVLMVFLNFRIEFSLLIVGLIAILYSTFGGLRAVFYTAILQAFTLLIIFAVIIFNGLKVVSLNKLFVLPEGYFDVSAFGGMGFFWFGILFGTFLVISSADSWQRIFAAKSIAVAKKTAIWTALLKSLVVVLSFVLGVIAFHLFPGVEPDSVVFVLMQEMLAPGLLGLGVVSLLSIILSTIDSSIMIGASTLVKDFFLQRKRADKYSESKNLMITKFMAFGFGLASLILAYFVSNIAVLVIVAAQILLIFSPAILGNLIFDIKNEKAAFYSILVGFVITIGLLPFLPLMAFIPGVFTALIVYIVLTLKKV